MSRIEILAVHKKKLEESLRELKLWDFLINGELKCSFCGATITLGNFGFIIPSGEEILFCCSSSECVFKLKKSEEEKHEIRI